MAISATNTYSGGGLVPYLAPEKAIVRAVILPGGVNYPAGQVLGFVAGTGTAVNEVQTVTITGTPTGGTFKLGFGGLVTASIAHNAGAAVVQTALAALSNIGTGNVTCAGGTFPGTAVTVTFTGALAGRNVPMLQVVDPAFTGGTSPAAAVAETTAGKTAAGYWKSYSDAASDGSEVARLILKYAAVTNPDGSVQSLSGTVIGTQVLTVPAYVNGVFLGSDLTGLDANGLADLNGRVIGGDPSALTASGTVIYIP